MSTIALISIQVRDDDRATPIFHAACWNHVEITKSLVSAGANLYTQRNDGFTALHVAAKNNQPKITEVLVEAMGDLGIQEVRASCCRFLYYADTVLTRNTREKEEQPHVHAMDYLFTDDVALLFLNNSLLLVGGRSSATPLSIARTAAKLPSASRHSSQRVPTPR